MESNGWKYIIARLTFNLWVSVAIFALPVYFGYAAVLVGLLFFPFYIEGAILYFVANLAFSLPASHWQPYTFWETVVTLLALAVIVELKMLIIKFNQ